MSLSSSVKPPHVASRFRAGRLFRRPGWNVLTLSAASLLWAGCQTSVGPDKSGADINEPEKTSGEDSSTAQPGTGTATPSQQPGTSTGEGSPGVGDTFTDKTGDTTSSDSSSFPESTDTPDEDAHLRFMVVKTGDQIVELNLNSEKKIAYRVIGYFSDGKTKDMSSEVTWTVSDPKIGAFNSNTLTLSKHDELFVKSGMVVATSGEIQARSQVTVAAYKQTGADQDFVFVLPYENKTGPSTKQLKFKTNVQALDVFFSVDTTSSMRHEIARLTNSLTSTIVPTLQKEIADTQFGVGAVEDFPVSPFGDLKIPPQYMHDDQPFRLKQGITSKIGDVLDGMKDLSLGRGGDIPEAILEGLFQVATGKGLTGPGRTSVASNSTGVGGVGFRKVSMPVVVSITDAASHAPGETGDACNRDYSDEVKKVAATRAQTEQALKDICARVITVASEGNANQAAECSPRVDGERLAKATEARVSPLVWDKNRPAGCAAGQCCTGLEGKGRAPGADGLCDLVFDVDAQGTGLGKSIVSGVQALAFFAPFDVISEKEGESSSLEGKALPSGKSTLDFFKSIRASSHGSLPIPGLPKPIPSGETFKRVTPGTEISFSIESYNGFVKPTTQVQTFRAKVGVKADQCQGLALDKREVVFVIPPKPLVAG